MPRVSARPRTAATDNAGIRIVQQPARRTADRGPASGRGAGATVAWTLTVGLAALMIGLTWINAARVIRAERVAAGRHGVAVAGAQAQVIATELGRQLTDANVLLRLLANRWVSNPLGFDLAAWFRPPLSLPHGARLFLLDATGQPVQSDRPGRPAHDPGVQATFMALRRALARQPDPARLGLVIGRAEPERAARPGQAVPAWRVDLARGLRAADGQFAGAVVMALPVRRLLASGVPAAVAPRSVVVLVGTRTGQVRAVIGLAAGGLMPGADLAGVPAFAALRGSAAPPAAVGPLEPGGRAFLYAFHRVGAEPLAVLVGLDEADVLHGPRALAAETRWFGLAISALIVLAAMVVLGEIEAMRRRERRLARDRSALAAANGALASAKREADAKTAQLEGLLAGLPDGVVMFDSDFRLVAWNRQASDLAGIPARLLRVGTPFEAMLRAQAEAGEFGPVDPDAEVARRMALVAAGQAVGRSERPRPDGRFLELRREVLAGGGFVTLFTDVTDRKRAEDALREARAVAEAATAAKSRLVAVVSHEIRTPLQALLHGIELLADASLDPMFRRLLAGMRQAGTSLLRLLEDILDVSRIEAGRLTLQTERCDPRRPLERAVEMLRPIAAERGVSLALEVAPDVPATILGDPARLQQVVVNLLSNAAKFSRPGLVTLRAGLAPGPSSGPVLRVAVTDQGPPIAPEQRALLFQPFSRLGPSAKAATGVGLGLSICRDLVVLMGGEVGCSAAGAASGMPATALGDAGQGNVFWFTVPLATGAEAPLAGPQPEAAAPGAPPRVQLRILLAEDVAVSRLVTATLLRREGHAVHPVADGASAVQAAARGAYDLVLMDIQLPGMDGLGATRAIRALPAAAGAVPILGLTGSATPEECAAFLVAGMGEVLAKPIPRDALLAALTRHAGPFRGAGRRAASPVAGAPPPDPWDAVLSAPRLAELRENLVPAVLARVTEECLTDLAELLERLRRALGDGDSAAAVAAAHAMAGLAGGYGLVALERTVRTVLGTLRSGRIDEAASRGTELQAELDRAAGRLRQALGSEMA